MAGKWGYSDEVSVSWDSEDCEAVLGVFYWLQQWGDRWWLSDRGVLYVFPRNPNPQPPMYDEYAQRPVTKGERLSHVNGLDIEVIPGGSE